MGLPMRPTPIQPIFCLCAAIATLLHPHGVELAGLLAHGECVCRHACSARADRQGVPALSETTCGNVPREFRCAQSGLQLVMGGLPKAQSATRWNRTSAVRHQISTMMMRMSCN